MAIWTQSGNQLIIIQGTTDHLAALSNDPAIVPRKAYERRTEHCQPRGTISCVPEGADQRDYFRHRGRFGDRIDILASRRNSRFLQGWQDVLQVRPATYQDSNGLLRVLGQGLLDDIHHLLSFTNGASGDGPNMHAPVHGSKRNRRHERKVRLGEHFSVGSVIPLHHSRRRAEIDSEAVNLQRLRAEHLAHHHVDEQLHGCCSEQVDGLETITTEKYRSRVIVFPVCDQALQELELRGRSILKLVHHQVVDTVLVQQSVADFVTEAQGLDCALSYFLEVDRGGAIEGEG
ncbi:hypothetical protein D3C78_768400 [compost metagenome]